MSRGLGALQREIKRMLDLVNEQMRFADIRSAFIMMRGGDLEQDILTPAFERSLKRALKGLIDREDVLIVHGKGGPGDPTLLYDRRVFCQLHGRESEGYGSRQADHCRTA